MTNAILIIFGGLLVLWFISVCRGVPPVNFTIPVSTETAHVEVKKGDIHTISPKPCKNWHTVLAQGTTQWELARRHDKGGDKHQWLRTFRLISGKEINDDSLLLNERVCVEW